jgi:hypothetical protein
VIRFCGVHYACDVSHPPENAAHSLESNDPGRSQRPGSLRTEVRQSDPEPLAISVSELMQILSAFVIVCGVLAVVAMAM